MKNRIIVLAGLLALLAPAYAQVDTSWVRRYAGPANSLDSATAIATDPAGNVYVTGRSDTLGQADIVTLKYDTNGNLLWRARFNGGYGNDIPYAAEYSAGPSKGSGTVHVTGTSKGPSKTDDYFFVTLSYGADSGNLRWTRLDSGIAGNSAGQALTVDPAGNTYAVGYLGLDDSLDRTVLSVVSYDTAGSLRWRYIWRGPDSISDRAVAVDYAAAPPVKGSGTVHVTGTSKSPGTDYPHDDIVTFAFKPDSGTLRWSRRLDYRGASDSAVAIAADPDSYGRVYVVGTVRDTSGFSYFATIAYDSLGDTAWVRILDGGAGVNRPHAMATAGTGTKGSGTVHVTGTSKGPSKAADLDYYTVCYSASGIQQWTARYDGGNGDDLAYAVAVAGTGTKGSGTVHVTGTSKGPSKASTWDIYTVAYSPTGVRLWDHRYDNGGTDIGLAIATDTALGVYVAGPSSSALDTTLDYVTLKYQSPTAPAAGWSDLAPLPGGLAYSGAWLACNAGAGADGKVYVCRGNRSPDFAAYDPVGNSWTTLLPMGPGPSGKTPGKGSRAAAGAGCIWSFKANNTREFWSYAVDAAEWSQLADVPLGLSGKKVKSGADLAFVPAGVLDDTGYVYMLKGCRTEFFRYNTVSGAWQSLPDAPIGVRAKWDKGSFIVYDGDRTIYAQKGKYYFGDRYSHELWTFDIVTGQWAASALRGMPLYGLYNGSMRKKKANDGAAGAFYDGAIYALKGGNTRSLFRYETAAAEWTQLDDMPLGSAGRRVKSGGDIDSDGCGILYALKGNKTAEFYRFVVGGKLLSAGVADEAVVRDALSSATIVRGVLSLRLTADGSRQDAALFTADGRRVMTLKPGANDVSRLAAGIYFVKSTFDNRRSTMSRVVITP